MNRPKITLTGADERTDIAELAKLEAEIAFLYRNQDEKLNRYPRKEWILEAIAAVPHAAIHICGRIARVQLIDKQLDDLIARAARIQINGSLHPAILENICAQFPNKTIITQHNADNRQLLEVPAPNHSLLMDESGGRGITPHVWNPPRTSKPVGFAGGLGPHNIREQIKRMNWCSRSGWWVDMESKIRTEEDWFSMDFAMAATAEFHNTVRSLAIKT